MIYDVVGQYLEPGSQSSHQFESVKTLPSGEAAQLVKGVPFGGSKRHGHEFESRGLQTQGGLRRDQCITILSIVRASPEGRVFTPTRLKLGCYN